MAKIGKLILDKSEWQNKQIVSEQWINKSLQTFSKLPDNKGYSYGWWTNDKVGYYEAAGRGRQTISVIPSKNMIVTMLGGEFDAGTIGKYIFQSIQSSKAAALPPSQEQVLTNDTVLNLLSIDSALQLPVALQATCKKGNEFVLHYNQLCRINNFYFHFFMDKKNIQQYWKKQAILLR